MDPNEATQKLLLQDPFHEVKRKRDREKETLADADDVRPIIAKRFGNKE